MKDRESSGVGDVKSEGVDGESRGGCDEADGGIAHVTVVGVGHKWVRGTVGDLLFTER